MTTRAAEEGSPAPAVLKPCNAFSLSWSGRKCATTGGEGKLKDVARGEGDGRGVGVDGTRGYSYDTGEKAR